MPAEVDISSNHFLLMIQHLRAGEEVMLYDNILVIREQDAEEVARYLVREYETESLEYPHKAPAFDPGAALWAARIVYVGAQLMLYRENKESDLNSLLPDHAGLIDASAMLSADLCLRFLPPMIEQLKRIDPDDRLITILEEKLSKWHYSAVSFGKSVNNTDLEVIVADATLRQLYINRIIKQRNTDLAKHPGIRQMVQESMGMYGSEFWNELKSEIIENE